MQEKQGKRVGCGLLAIILLLTLIAVFGYVGVFHRSSSPPEPQATGVPEQIPPQELPSGTPH